MTHAQLVDLAALWLVSRMRCTVVAAELVTGAGETADAIGFRSGYSYLVECKVSRADFRADAAKPHRQPGSGMGSYRWYLTPPRLLRREEVPAGWGLLEARPGGGLRVKVRHPDAARPVLAPRDEQRVLLSVIGRMAAPHAWPARTNARVWVHGRRLQGGFV